MGTIVVAIIILTLWTMTIIYLPEPLAKRFKHAELIYIAACGVAMVSGVLLMAAWWGLMAVVA